MSYPLAICKYAIEQLLFQTMIHREWICPFSIENSKIPPTTFLYELVTLIPNLKAAHSKQFLTYKSRMNNTVWLFECHVSIGIGGLQSLPYEKFFQLCRSYCTNHSCAVLIQQIWRNWNGENSTDTTFVFLFHFSPAPNFWHSLNATLTIKTAVYHITLESKP